MPALKDIAKALGLSEDASETDVTTAVQALKAKADTAPSDDTIQKLTAAAEQGVQAAKRLHEVEKKNLLDGAITSRQMLPVERDSLEALYDLDGGREKVEALLAARPKGTFNEAGSGEAGKDNADKDKTTGLSDGSEYAYDVSPEAIERATVQALKDAGYDPATASDEQKRDAGRKAYAALLAAA